MKIHMFRDKQFEQLQLLAKWNPMERESKKNTKQKYLIIPSPIFKTKKIKSHPHTHTFLTLTK